MIDTAEPLAQLAGKRVLVTGAGGSIGSALVPVLYAAGLSVVATDVETMDVRFTSQVQPLIQSVEPDIVFHLAGAKHAPEGEKEPQDVLFTNAEGTWNVLRACDLHAPRAKVVLSSTCKACDPETAYGASKLIAERMVLNAGGSVARLYNVRETSGNVFRLWESIPEDQPIPVTGCSRYFISLHDAVALHLWAAVLGSGRYAVDPGPEFYMPWLANTLYPGREQLSIPPRRGDRLTEPLHAACEAVEPLGNGLLGITSPHDPVRATEKVAA